MTSNSDTSLEEYSVIAFYGVDSSSIAAANFYGTVTHWCQQLGYPPEKIVVHGPGHSGKCVSFSRINSRLQKVGFDGIQDFEIYSLPSNAKYPMFDYCIDAIYNNDSQSSYAAIAASPHLLQLCTDSTFSLAQTIIQDLKPIYGIGYTRERREGPLLYVIGIGQGIGPSSGEAYEKRVEEGHWGGLGMERQVYREGVIRDVYPWNFLTNPHLEAKVNNISLQDWIQQDEIRGNLCPLHNGMWLWKVAKQNILTIRSTLWEAKIIFNWKNYL